MRLYLVLILLGYTILQAQPTILSPGQTDEIIIDNGATGKADPNDITTVDPLSIGNYQARAATATHEIFLQGSGLSVIANWNTNANSPVSPPAIISQSSAGVLTFGVNCATPSNPNP